MRHRRGTSYLIPDLALISFRAFISKCHQSPVIACQWPSRKTDHRAIPYWTNDLEKEEEVNRAVLFSPCFLESALGF